MSAKKINCMTSTPNVHESDLLNLAVVDGDVLEVEEGGAGGAGSEPPP